MNSMLSWEEIVQNYISKYSHLIKKTTRPLKEHFGINYFTYHKIDEKGKYTVLVDRPDWAEHYVREKIYLDDPYLRHPNFYGSGVCLLEQYGSDEYKSRILIEGKAFNMDLGVMLIQKQQDSVEFFGFSANKNASSLENLYLNHTSLLKSFAAHFKNEMKKTLTNMEREANSLLILKGEDFLNRQPIIPEIGLDSRLNYLKDLGFEIDAIEKLSSRERECICLLIEGKTAKETAAILKLSPRTIESYFENIKTKLSFWSKQQILELGKILREVGLI